MTTTISTTSKLIVHILAILFLVKLTTARPPNTNENQEIDQINLPEFRKFLSSYNALSNYPASDDVPLDRLQMRLLAQYAQNTNSIVGSGGGGGGNEGGSWNYDLYRTPEMKRQIRYRQCYFNPISCFRK